jgi:heptosyltransferase-2
MLSRFFKPSKVRTILFISLSNVGDVVLTFPVFDALCQAYPDALFAVVVSPKGKSFFEGHPRVRQVHILEKQAGLAGKVRWLRELRREKFDLVVDLRNSMLPFLTRARRRTRPVFAGESQGHMRDKHLHRLKTVLRDIPLSTGRFALHWTKEESAAAMALLRGASEFAVVAPGAADDKKRWTPQGFVDVIRHLTQEMKMTVIVVGDRRDGKFAAQILKGLPGGVMNLCGITSLKTLAFVMSRARLALVNDSGALHLASYLNVPTVALFGPTDHRRYGPWGSRGRVVHSASGRMDDVRSSDVIEAVSGVAG